MMEYLFYGGFFTVLNFKKIFIFFKYIFLGLTPLISQFITVSGVTPSFSASSLMSKPLSILAFLIFSPRFLGSLG